MNTITNATEQRVDVSRMTVRQFSRDMHNFLYSENVMSLLDNLECGWLDGGCRILANAIWTWLGGNWIADRMVIQANDMPQHVVVCVGGRYLDGDGVSTLKTLLTRWTVIERLENPHLADYDANDLNEWGIPGDADIEMEVIKMLEARYDYLDVIALICRS